MHSYTHKFINTNRRGTQACKCIHKYLDICAYFYTHTYTDLHANMSQTKTHLKNKAIKVCKKCITGSRSNFNGCHFEGFS